MGAIAVVAFLGAFQSLRPVVGDKPLSMVLTIQMFMLLAGALMILFTKTALECRSIQPSTPATSALGHALETTSLPCTTSPK